LCRAPGRLPVCEDHGCPLAHEFFGKSRKLIEPAFGEAHVETHILAINEPMACEHLAQ
jgi:hypothetical protein